MNHDNFLRNNNDFKEDKGDKIDVDADAEVQEAKKHEIS